MVTVLQQSFGLDSTQRTHAITSEVFTPKEIKSVFDAISYGKAASVIRMLEKLYGSKKFYEALHLYLEKWYQNFIIFKKTFDSNFVSFYVANLASVLQRPYFPHSTRLHQPIKLFQI